MVKVKYTKREVGDLLISILILGFAFMNLIFEPTFPNYFLALGLTVLCYFPRELIQRIYSRRMSMYSQYRIWIPGVLAGILSSFIGFVFAAVGSIDFSLKYYERYGRKQIGISVKQIGLAILSGYWYSIIFGVISILIGFLGVPIFFVIAKINFYIAFFNMIPIAKLDGVKIIRWRPLLWVCLLFLSFGLLIASHFLG